MSLGTTCKNLDYGGAAKAHQKLVSDMDHCQFIQSLKTMSSKAQEKSPMFKVTYEYMNMVASLLLFIRASREGLWILHLVSLEQLCPLFFSQNRMKYMQHVPEYIAKMYELQHSDPDVWDELVNGNFCVKKSLIPFTSLGVDQALEQENRTMKVLGRLRSLTQKPAALARFFLVAPELARLSLEAENMVGLSRLNTTHQYQLTDQLYRSKNRKYTN
jgi:hypothetical protein